MNTTRRQGTRPEIPKSTEAAAPLSASFVEEGEAFMKLSGRARRRVTADRSQRESFEVVVIGGGQAGLSLGYHLAKRGFHFVILDASARVGDTWRSRWDSLRLFTPARYDGLDGMPFPAPPHSFPTKNEMADYLERYAKRFALPIRNAARVDRLRKEGRRYVVTVGEQEIETDQVVIAMANYQRPKVPDFATELRSDIVQFHSKEYRGPAQLREGSVLVVGAGNSGSEVAIELARRHEVWLSGRHTGHLPFRVEGLAARVLLLRFVLKVLFHRVLTIGTALGRRLRPGIVSRGGPLIRIKPRDMVAAGIRQAPRTTGVEAGLPRLADGRVLDVQNVVWCTGYHPGFSWIDLPIFDERGVPRHTGGIVEGAPGLYFLGLHFLRAVSSGMIHGVSTDAKRIADAVAARRQAQYDDAEPHSGRRTARSIASGDATDDHIVTRAQGNQEDSRVLQGT